MAAETEREGAVGAGAKGRELGPEELTREDLLVPELVDAALVRICRGAGGVDLALGRTLAELEIGDRLIALGRSDIDAYAVETLGMPASSARFLAATARALEPRPLLTRAVAGGAVSLRKAAIVAHVAKGDAEPAWTVACLHKTEQELEELVRSAGAVPREIDLETESALWLMTPEEQDRFDRGIAVARILVGSDPASS